MQALVSPQDAAPTRPRVAVLATGVTPVGSSDGRSLEEMIFDITHGTLARIGLTAKDIDSIVLHGDDQMNGRVISCMVSVGPAGGVDKDVTMIPSSGEHAFIYAHLRLLAGQGKNVLVVGWGKPSEGVSPDHAERVCAEPYVLRQIGMNDTVAAALQASRLGAVPAEGTEDQLTAWPLTKGDLPGNYDILYAAVLATEGNFEADSEVAWVEGAGWSMDVYELGARDVGELRALKVALEQLQDRGVPGPSNWESVEIGAPSEVAVRAIAASLPLPEGARVNAAGTTSELHAASASSGLGRFLKAIDSLAGQGADRFAAGIGLQGFAGQGAAVAVFRGTGAAL